MRTFWLGLAVAAMAAAAWASDEANVRVGDWVKAKRTSTISGFKRPGLLLNTTLTRVKAIEDGMAILDVETTIDARGDGQLRTTSREVKVPFAFLNLIDYRLGLIDYNRGRSWSDVDWDGVTVEVLEEAELTFETNGVTFEEVFRKVKLTVPAEGDWPELEMVRSVWIDVKAPFTLARVSRSARSERMVLPPGDHWMEFVETTERVAYGRAVDPIPEGEGGEFPSPQ